MGLIISRFRKEATVKELLEDVEKKIRGIEEFKIQTTRRQRRLVEAFLIYSIVFYIIGAAVFYFVYFPDTLRQQILYSLPMMLIPIIIWLLKSFLHWYYRRQIRLNDESLIELRKEKRRLLDDVKEKETYKVAKELLEKYDPDQLKNSPGSADKSAVSSLFRRSPPSPSNQVPMLTSTLRQRIVSRQMLLPGVNVATNQNMMQITPLNGRTPMNRHLPALTGAPNGNVLPLPVVSNQIHGSAMQRVPGLEFGIPFPPGPPMPRPILPRERGVMDKMIEYLVGDGPSQRYALVCRHCHSHNGMALQDEYEYLAFRCCYCYSYNPARRQRPNAPRLSNEHAERLLSNSDPQPTVEEVSDSEHSDEENEGAKPSSVSTDDMPTLVESDGEPANYRGDSSSAANQNEANQSADSENEVFQREALGLEQTGPVAVEDIAGTKETNGELGDMEQMRSPEKQEPATNNS